MKTANKKGIFKYLSYNHEPRWLTIFIHTGFVTAIAIALGFMAWAFFSA